MFRKPIVLALAAIFSLYATISSAAVTTSGIFNTPVSLSAGDTAKGFADAEAFDLYAGTSATITAMDDLELLLTATVNPFLIGGNSIELTYSFNGLPSVVLPITPTNGTGAASLNLSMSALDTLELFVDGEAGRAGNLVTVVLLTEAPAAVPLPAAGGMLLTALGGIYIARRRAKKAS